MRTHHMISNTSYNIAIRGAICPRRGCAVLGFMLGVVLFVVLAVGPAYGDEAASTPLPPLAELEQNVRGNSRAAVLLSQIKELRHSIARERALMWPSLVGGAGMGWNDEPINETSEERLEYSKFSTRIGLSMPLLGGLNRRSVRALELEKDREALREELGIAFVRGVANLREAYATMWIARRQIDYAEHFVQRHQDIATALTERRELRLVLDADLKEFLSAFALAKRHIQQAKAMISRAGAAIALAVGHDVDGGSVAEFSLPFPEMDAERLAARLEDSHPTLVALERQAAIQRRIIGNAGWTDMDTDLDVMYSASKDDPGTWGRGVSVGLSVKLPLGLPKSASEGVKAAEEALERIGREQELTVRELALRVREDMGDYKTMEASLEFLESRLHASLEAKRERALRCRSLPGDVREQYLASVVDCYVNGMQLMDAELTLIKEWIDILELQELAYAGAHAESDKETAAPLPQESAPRCCIPGLERRTQLIGRVWMGEGCAGVSTIDGHKAEKAYALAMEREGEPSPLADATGSADAAAGRVDAESADERSELRREKPADTPSRGIYIWESADFLDSGTRGPLLDALERWDIRRLLLSLDGAQIANAATEHGAKALQDLLDEAETRGMDAVLLLGEPSWMLPEGREDLVAIIESLSSFPFAGLHLDIEPEQLASETLAHLDVEEQLAATVQRVVEVSPWPLGLSLHPRHAGVGDDGGDILGTLQAHGLDSVTLMIYVADADTVAGRASLAMQKHEDLPYSVAVSVEPFLDTQLTWAATPLPKLFNILDEITETVQTTGRFQGVIIQSWKWLELPDNESSIQQ